MKRVGTVFRISVVCVFLLGPATAFAQSVAGVAATAAALDAVLSHLINQVSTEVKQILQEAQGEVQGLEATFATDLYDFEGMTVSDVENLTGNALNQVDNQLNSALADLTRLENSINAQVATQIRDAAHLANITWNNVAKDAEKLIVKVEQGTAVILDATMIQVIRIITLVGAFVVLVIGIIILIRNRVPGIVVGSVGLLIIIFCFTPLFSAVVSNWSRVSKVITLDESVDPPQVLIISPTSLKYGDQGTLQILGMNFLPKTGSSKLLVGASSQNAMREEPRASINPATITLPLPVLSAASGTYYMKIVRDDGQESPVLSMYTAKPEQVGMRIVYTVWQTGRANSRATGRHETRRIQTDHGTGKTTKTYNETYTPATPWRSQSFSKSNVEKNHVSELTENISGTSLKIHYKLTSGPFYDRWRGWYNADYTIAIAMTDYNFSTRSIAEHGEVNLYYDEESHTLSAGGTSLYSNLGLYSYELKLGAIMHAPGVAVPAERRLPSLPGALRGGVATGALHGIGTPFHPAPSAAQTTFVLGSPPTMPGFTPNQTWYDVSVRFGNVSKDFTGATGQKSVYDGAGKLIMTFFTDSSGTLKMTWMGS